MALGAWLVVVGVCDLLRATRDATTWRRRGSLGLLGVALLVLAATLDVPGHGDPVLLLVWVVGYLAWLVTSSAALDPSSARRPAWRAAAFAGFAVPVAVLALPTWSVASQTGTVALVLGAAVVQLSTANLLVRLLLDAIGVPATDNEKTLKGGRVLGPMERLFILVLGLLGNLTAAVVVVAAKGLLRYPELQRRSRDEGPTDLSEYFLIGSFASWLLALGGLVLVRLG